MFYSFSVEPPKIYYMGSWWVCVVVEKMKLIPAYDVSYGWWQCERAPNLQGGHRSRVLEERDDFGKDGTNSVEEKPMTTGHNYEQRVRGRCRIAPVYRNVKGERRVVSTTQY
jgi:hypothetical protein